LAKGQEWSHLVREVFPDPLQKEALDLLGLFLLHRFRQFNYEEVVAMLNFDLMDTVAGQQIYDMGREKGVDEGYLGASQEMLIGILTERFGVVPSEIMAHIRAIKQWEVLKNLPIQALRCPYVTSFKKKLS